LIPGQTVIGLLAFSFDPAKVYDHLEREKLVDMYDPSVNQMAGMTTKELLTLFTGDIAMTVNDVKSKEVLGVDMKGQMITRKTPEPQYCAVLGIANKEKLHQLLDGFAQKGLLSQMGDYYIVQNKVFIIEKGPAIVITGADETLQSIKQGNGVKLSPELEAMLTGNASSFYLNLQNIPETAYQDAGAKMGENIKNSQVEVVEIIASTVKDNVSTGKLTVKFRQKNQNALITLGQISKEFGKMMNPDMSVDAAATDEAAPVSN
jgi:hypothetical protein